MSEAGRKSASQPKTNWHENELDHIERQDHVPVVVLSEKEYVDENRGKGESEIEKPDHPDEGFGVSRQLPTDAQEIRQELVNIGKEQIHYFAFNKKGRAESARPLFEIRTQCPNSPLIESPRSLAFCWMAFCAAFWTSSPNRFFTLLVSRPQS